MQAVTQKNIVVVGYPKSGTTWVSRLVAELVKCPLEGNWGETSTDKALYKEGCQRTSDHKCFKSHHTYHELKVSSDLKIHKMIYIIRDPRDVVISGSAYFYFTIPLLTDLMNRLRARNIARIINNIYNYYKPKKSKRRLMIKAVLAGNRRISIWLKTSWKDHYMPFLKDKILIIRYEDLLDNPLHECKKIGTYLNIKLDDGHIRESIDNQSFQNRKKELTDNSDASLVRLLRKGTHGEWKKVLHKEEIALFRQKLQNDSTFYQF